MPPDAFETWQNKSRFAALDGLRFLCIAAVLWHHYPLGAAMADLPPLAQRGFLGVDFFFVLSGFLITTLLLREEARAGGFSLRNFYIRRALRILPPYLLVVGVAAGGYIVIKGQTEYLALLPFYLLFLANFLQEDIPLLAPTWSLSVEEQFYLLWPLALRLVPRRAALPVLGVLVAANVAGIMGAFAPLGLEPFALGPLWIALPNATYAPILMGAALALILDRRAGFAALSFALGSRAAAPVLMAGLVLLVMILPGDLRGWPNLALHLGMTATLAALVLREDNGLAGVLHWRPLARLGEISYGVYLYHLFALHITHAVLGRLGADAPGLVLVTYAALSFLMAEISFRTLETWVRRFRPKAG
ncbi:acyltransferase family protein [Stagnihabitans tardus]|uniref:Acyltransferase family protein n=1 Tax=Stagnihabitans tardus TaxID=2699202 RepID=A0AAE4YH44_9RHOB|nr:acyltransferase [Stagnihabitans tardus]NBZ89670.1 acyltransferase family protein [Stagnihabitans tardus]